MGQIQRLARVSSCVEGVRTGQVERNQTLSMRGERARIHVESGIHLEVVKAIDGCSTISTEHVHSIRNHIATSHITSGRANIVGCEFRPRHVNGVQDIEVVGEVVVADGLATKEEQEHSR